MNAAEIRRRYTLGIITREEMIRRLAALIA